MVEPPTKQRVLNDRSTQEDENQKIRLHTCHVCDKVFAQSGHLNVHKRVHTDDKPYPCTFCDKAFAENASLRKHIRTHTGEKPFKCTICNKAFARKDSWTIHMRIHLGKKPFECVICKKTFVQSGDLTKHTRTHTGDKPYACTVCNQAFARKNVLVTHVMYKHTGEKPERCVECGSTHVSKYDLKKHMRRHTGPFCFMLCGSVVPHEKAMCGRCMRSNGVSQYGVKEETVFNYLFDHPDERLNEVMFTKLSTHQMGCGVRRKPDGLMVLEVDETSTIKNTMHAIIPVDDEENKDNDDDDDDDDEVERPFLRRTQVLFMLEIDENQHIGYDERCEFTRLQEIQDRDGSALFVIRYNPDQPGGLEEEKLEALAQRLLEVLDGDYLLALDEPSGIYTEYHGYTERRKQRLADVFLASQTY